MIQNFIVLMSCQLAHDLRAMSLRHDWLLVPMLMRRALCSSAQLHKVSTCCSVLNKGRKMDKNTIHNNLLQNNNKLLQINSPFLPTQSFCCLLFLKNLGFCPQLKPHFSAHLSPMDRPLKLSQSLPFICSPKRLVATYL